jgi:hypothetical protein
MKYLFPANNLLTAATGYVPLAESINVRTSATKTGGGMVSLIGGATEDATYDIEIVNNTIVGTPTVSTPVFTGVGNPVMSALAASSGVAAQVFTATLVDLGTDTTFAFLPFQGVTLQAKSSGSGGNNITVDVDESGITRTGTDYALIEPLVKAQNEYVGDQWNFGAVVLNSDGTIPSGAPRISFGDDPQVYRQYKEFSDGRYVYRFSPAPVRDVQEGARVKTVAGSRTVTMTDGMSTRTYTSVTTLYSLLNAILSDGSALVDVVEPVTVNLAPGGMGMVEMSVRTVSYVQSITRDGTVFVRNADLPFTVSDDAPTEILTITCSAADYIGSEVWEVRGSVSGELADAVTAVAYDGTDYDFTIPQLLPPSSEPAAAEKSAVFELLDRADGEGAPVLCVENFVLGADARNRTYTYIWRARPPECNCDDVDIDGGPDGEILGTEEPYVGELIPAALQTRVQNLYSWRNTFVASQASILAGTTAVTGDTRIASAGDVLTGSDDTTTPGLGDAVNLFQRVGAVVKVDRIDIEAANAMVALLHSTLVDIYETNSNTMPTAAGTAWDTALTDLGTDFSAISTLTGSNFWRSWAAKVANGGMATDIDVSAGIEASFSEALLTNDFDGYKEKWLARMDYIRTLGGVSPDFDGATRRGNNVWQDQGGTAWFESQDGLLPIQPGFYYHSCRLGEDDEPVSTREFGIGVGVGCADALKYGDKLIITISPVGNLRVTYQVGDQFRVAIINGAPAQLGGGRTGTDTQTWRVRGSVLGGLTDYSLYKPSPGTYSASGITFKITPGGIDDALGDEFEWYVEGGQFRYRKNGGVWSSNTQITTAAITIDSANGAAVGVQFTTGAAPSFVVGDSYSFRATALHTIERMCSPVHGGTFSNDGSGELLIADDLHMADPTATVGGVYETMLFVRATIECFVIVTPKENVYSYPAQAYACSPGDNVFSITEDIRGFDITHLEIAVGNDGGDYTPVTMLWLGHPTELAMPNDIADPGITRKRIKLGNRSRAVARLGANIQHSAVAESSFDDFVDLLNDAAVNHDGRFAVVWPAGAQAECGIVRYTGDEIEVEDERDYQPEDSTDRLLRFTLPLEAVA